MLRLHGDIIPTFVLEKFDTDLRQAAEHILGGTVSDTSWWQASTGVSKGGIGLRAAADTALSSFIASRVSSRPQVAHMANDMEIAGLCTAILIMDAYDLRTNAAMKGFLDTLAPTSVDEAIKAITSASTYALEAWNAMTIGEDPAAEAGASNSLSRGLGSFLPHPRQRHHRPRTPPRPGWPVHASSTLFAMHR